MNMNRKSILLSFAFSITMLVSGSLFGQDSREHSGLSTEYTTIHSESGLTFQVKRSDCPLGEGLKPLVYTFMKITNDSDQPKTVTFNFGLQYTEGCSGCGENSEHSGYLVIPAHSTVEGTCETPEKGLTRLIYNPNLQGGWKFEKVVLTNLSIQ